MPRLDNRVTPEYVLSQYAGTARDRRSFDFFRSQTGPMLSGPFDANFWTRLLLQFSHSEPTVWHSLLALSTLHEQYLLDNDHRCDHDYASNRRFALQHYNEAIGLLTGSSPESKPSTEVILVSCILFVCLELLLGNVEGAINHVHGGIKIIHGWKSEQAKSGAKSSQKSTPTVEFIEDNIGPLFDHFNLHSFIYGRPAPTFPIQEKSSDQKAKKFNSFLDARSSLLNLMNAGQQFAKAFGVYSHNHSPENGATAALKKANLVARIRRWPKAFDALMASPKMAQLNAEDLRAANLLRLQHKIGAIWIPNALNAGETSFDSYIDDFDSLVRLATSIYEKDLETTPTRRYASFSFEMQNIAPLYITAIKCRNPVIRRNALNLMKRMPRREGFWDSRLVIKMAERAIDIEEEGLEELKDSTGSVVPSEWSRVHEISLAPESVGNSRRALVSFTQRPNGLDCERSCRQEYFEV